MHRERRYGRLARNPVSVELLHGQARGAAEGRIFLTLEVDYKMVMDVLDDQHGQESAVSRSFVDGLLERQKPSHEDSEALTKWSLKMLIACTSVNFLGNLSSL